MVDGKPKKFVWQYCTVKSPKSRRLIPLTAEAWVALSRLLPEPGDGRPMPGPEHPVFANREGKPLDWRNIAQDFVKPAAKKLWMPWVSFHILRHTLSTLAANEGMGHCPEDGALGARRGEDGDALHAC